MKITKDEIRYIIALERISGVHAKICIIVNGSPNFLVEKEKMARVIGKKGEMIKRIRSRIGKRVDIFEYADGAEGFAKNAFPGAKVNDATIQDNNGSKTLRLVLDAENRSKILNNNPRLRKVKGIVEKYYGIPSLKVR